MGAKRTARPIPTPGTPTLLRVDEVAEILGLSRSRAYDLLRRGEIPGTVRFERALLVRGPEFWRWLNGQEEAGR